MLISSALIPGPSPAGRKGQYPISANIKKHSFGSLGRIAFEMAHAKRVRCDARFFLSIKQRNWVIDGARDKKSHHLKFTPMARLAAGRKK